jgi:hypothetical protein
LNDLIITPLSHWHHRGEMEQPIDHAKRKAQWKYLLPILGAPLAHNAVTFLRDAPPLRRKILFASVFALTATAVCTRLWLMGDSGYPGAERAKPDRLVARRTGT